MKEVGLQKWILISERGLLAHLGGAAAAATDLVLLD